MIEELLELFGMALKGVDGSANSEDGADQIGTGLGSELQKVGLLGIGFKLQEINGAGDSVAAAVINHGATPPAASIDQRSQNSRCRT